MDDEEELTDEERIRRDERERVLAEVDQQRQEDSQWTRIANLEAGQEELRQLVLTVIPQTTAEPTPEERQQEQATEPEVVQEPAPAHAAEPVEVEPIPAESPAEPRVKPGGLW